jgi:hypothetical protein
MTRRIARDIHRKSSRKNGKGILHTYSESDATRKRLIKKLSLADVACIAWVVDKKKNKGADPYLFAMQKIAEYFQGSKIKRFIVAKRDTRKSYRDKISNICAQWGIGAEFADPAYEKALQIADFYSWSIFSKFENHKEFYFERLKSSIVILS